MFIKIFYRFVRSLTAKEDHEFRWERVSADNSAASSLFPPSRSAARICPAFFVELSSQSTAPSTRSFIGRQLKRFTVDCSVPVNHLISIRRGFRLAIKCYRFMNKKLAVRGPRSSLHQSLRGKAIFAGDRSRYGLV